MASKFYSCIPVLVALTIFLCINIVYSQRYSDTHRILTQLKSNGRSTVLPQTSNNNNNNNNNSNNNNNNSNNNNHGVIKGRNATVTTNNVAIDNKNPQKDPKGNLTTKSFKSLTVTNAKLPPPTPTKPAVGLNAYEFKYILNPSKTCTNTPDIELVIGVSIARNNFDRRRTVRETWGTYAYQKDKKAALIFFIGNGTANESSEIDARIQNESRQFNDMVQQDYIDSYQNLSLKSISLLKWVSTDCPNVKFVLKADDDVYVNIPNLMPELRKLKEKAPEGKFLLGFVYKGALPIRNKTSKWYSSPQQFPGPVYPHYVSGTTYAMPSEAAKLMYQAALRTPLLWLEDIYITGMCRTEAGVAVQDTRQITHFKTTPSGCVFRKMITGHRYTDAEIRNIHKELYDEQLKC